MADPRGDDLLRGSIAGANLRVHPHFDGMQNGALRNINL
jgi:hypothetical protein